MTKSYGEVTANVITEEWTNPRKTFLDGDARIFPGEAVDDAYLQGLGIYVITTTRAAHNPAIEALDAEVLVFDNVARTVTRTVSKRNLSTAEKNAAVEAEYESDMKLKALARTIVETAGWNAPQFKTDFKANLRALKEA